MASETPETYEADAPDPNTDDVVMEVVWNQATGAFRCSVPIDNILLILGMLEMAKGQFEHQHQLATSAAKHAATDRIILGGNGHPLIDPKRLHV